MAKKKVKIFQTNLFSKKIKKLSKKQKLDLDSAIKKIVDDPMVGIEKKGDLIGIYVYKFKSSTQQLLLAYEWDEESRTLLMIGVHENFYREIKKSKK
jgi:mRNA-degrading endonuclease RelE of RelBE toxin-antitoxin system